MKNLPCSSLFTPLTRLLNSVFCLNADFAEKNMTFCTWLGFKAVNGIEAKNSQHSRKPR